MKYETLAYVAELLEREKDQYKLEAQRIQDQMKEADKGLSDRAREEEMDHYRYAYMDVIAKQSTLDAVLRDFLNHDWR